MLKTWFHFYASLKPKGKICLRKPTSFFNEIEIENELFSEGSFHGLALTFLEREKRYEGCSEPFSCLNTEHEKEIK